MLTTSKKKLILRNTDIFSAIPDTVLIQVIDTLKEVSVKAGEDIFSKGDSGTSMYIIVKGRVSVHDGELLLNYLNKGDVFDEMAALDPDVRRIFKTVGFDMFLDIYDNLEEAVASF